MLELAAKAARINLSQWVSKGCWMDEPDEEGFQLGTPDFNRWNPLTDDGDAFRLAMDLKMHVIFDTEDAENPQAIAVNWRGDTKAEYHDSDPYAATRRAIVRAAAEIGKNIG